MCNPLLSNVYKRSKDSVESSVETDDFCKIPNPKNKSNGLEFFSRVSYNTFYPVKVFEGHKDISRPAAKKAVLKIHAGSLRFAAA